jgi:orotate phosphoribosyltransferase
MSDPQQAADPAWLAELAADLSAASLLRGDFVLSSGARSSYYLDKYLFETDPSVLRRLGEALAVRVPAGTQKIAGTELGAVALATALSLETGIPFVIVRRAAKEYSTSKPVEGRLDAGDAVVLVEDVVTTGAQVLKAADKLVAQGVNIVAILAVVDREEGGREAIEGAGYRFETLFTRTSLGI